MKVSLATLFRYRLLARLCARLTESLFTRGVVFGLLSLTACAPLPVAQDRASNADNADSRAVISTEPVTADDALQSSSLLGPPLEAFTAQGRLSLQNGKRQDHVRFLWQHTGSDDVVLFMSPLGQGVAEIRRSANSAQLTQPNQPPVIADSLSALSEQVFGIPLPLDSLVDWLRGARPELTGEEAGWHVTVLDTTILPVEIPTSTSLPGLNNEGSSVISNTKNHLIAPYHQRRLLRKVRITREDVVLQLIVDSWDAG
ncbi:MAG: outer membrane lipoprotein LolB [Rugosibacter sp.]